MRRRTGSAGVVVVGAGVLIGLVATAAGFGVSLDEGGYASRWDASPSQSRSLDGGLTYNVGNFFGDSGYENFANQFTFSDGSGQAEVEQAVGEALDAWTAVDPATGLGAGFTFTAALGEAYSPFSPGAGAEIDIVAVDFGNSSPSGFTDRTVSGTVMMLSSGVAAGGGSAINGADIRLNSNFTASWTIEQFRAVLIHELGISLGLVDVDVPVDGFLPPFFDDNYDGTDSATALATLTNPWADQIDPFDPEGTPGLQTFSVNDGDPGFDTEGVDIVMETEIPVSLLSDPTLSNDDYAGRQFLYPVVLAIPEPSVPALLLAGLCAVAFRRRRAGA
ncbi:hypothetical protein BH23VER1_BH23VER1_15430 [soil metagenome]